MKKIVLFGSSHCPDCAPMKEFLSDNGVRFAYVDITESMFNLKMYLKYRDGRPEFAGVKKAGRVGVPFIVINNGERIIFGKPDIDELKD